MLIIRIRICFNKISSEQLNLHWLILKISHQTELFRSFPFFIRLTPRIWQSNRFSSKSSIISGSCDLWTQRHQENAHRLWWMKSFVRWQGARDSHSNLHRPHTACQTFEALADDNGGLPDESAGFWCLGFCRGSALFMATVPDRWVLEFSLTFIPAH